MNGGETGDDGVVEQAMHVPESFGDRGRNVDYQSILLKGAITKFEGREGIQVD